MRKIIICSVMLLSLTTTVQCTKQTTEEREVEQAGSAILRGETPPVDSVGKVGDYYINEKTAEFYGPKKSTEEGGWVAPVRF